MSQLFAYISTKTTVDPYVPNGDTRFLARDVSNAFVSLSGGHQRVGEIVLYPIQNSVPGHLLCDGREVSKESFPELYRFLGDTQGTATNPGKFVLPNYIGASAFTPAAAAEIETSQAGTTTSPTPSDPGLNPEFDYGGDRDSGGRRYSPGVAIP